MPGPSSGLGIKRILSIIVLLKEDLRLGERRFFPIETQRLRDEALYLRPTLVAS
jgi:hypothetical protein